MYAVVEIPLMASQALFRLGKRTLNPAPRAILDETGERSFVCETNLAATREGVTVGMRPAQALARCENLEMLPRSLEAEATVRRLLLVLAQNFAPRVEETQDNLVTVDLRGLEPEIFETTAEQLIERFKNLQLGVRIGISDTPDHARWSAHFADPVLQVRSLEAFLKRVPLSITEAENDLIDILHGWGITNMAQFHALPRDEIGHRLGRRGLNLWDAVAGHNPRLLEIASTKPRFSRSLSLEHRVESLDALLFILKRFIDELEVELSTANAAAYILELTFKLDNNNLQTKRIEVPEPSSRASTLFRILETALERLETKDAITGIRLSLCVTEARRRQGDLFAVAMEDAASFAETADRIATILGPDRSGSPSLSDSWKPDSFRIKNLDTDLGTSENPTQDTDEASEPKIGLPLSRIRPPEHISLLAKDGTPAQITGGPYAGEIVASSGPYNLSGHWWELSRWSRVEWDIELAQGGLYRIYRERSQWFMEGVYG